MSVKEVIVTVVRRAKGNSRVNEIYKSDDANEWGNITGFRQEYLEINVTSEQINFPIYQI